VIRTATSDDLSALLAHGRAFAAESGLPGTFCEAATRRTLGRAMADPDWHVLVLDEANQIRGGAILAFNAGYMREPQGYVQMFYVAPAWRGTDAARRLLAAICEVADARDCIAFFASPNAAIAGRNDRVFANLFAKFGFRPLAPVLVRRRGESRRPTNSSRLSTPDF
jgi:GNAT superfamily N-acetyltransferase